MKRWNYKCQHLSWWIEMEKSGVIALFDWMYTSLHLHHSTHIQFLHRQIICLITYRWYEEIGKTFSNSKNTKLKRTYSYLLLIIHKTYSYLRTRCVNLWALHTVIPPFFNITFGNLSKSCIELLRYEIKAN